MTWLALEQRISRAIVKDVCHCTPSRHTEETAWNCAQTRSAAVHALEVVKDSDGVQRFETTKHPWKGVLAPLDTLSVDRRLIRHDGMRPAPSMPRPLMRRGASENHGSEIAGIVTGVEIVGDDEQGWLLMGSGFAVDEIPEEGLAVAVDLMNIGGDWEQHGDEQHVLHWTLMAVTISDNPAFPDARIMPA